MCTFDPPHVAHLMVGEVAYRDLHLDVVTFVPAGAPWQKSNRAVSAPEHRWNMTVLAVDGVDEVLTAFITRRRRGPRAPTEMRISFSPTDDAARWTVRFDSDSCDTERAARAADVVVAGAASDLYVWVWNRPSIGQVDISGDVSVAELWQETVHVRWS